MSGCDGSGFARWVIQLLCTVICIVGRSKMESINVSVVAVFGICTVDLMTLFSILTTFNVIRCFYCEFCMCVAESRPTCKMCHICDTGLCCMIIACL